VLIDLLAAGGVAGLVLGLFGAGGTIVALPLLLYGAGLAPHEAIGTNALGVAAIAFAILAWRTWSRQARLADGTAFALPGLVGIAIGAAIGLAFSGSRLVFLLGFVVFLVAGWMAYLARRLDPVPAMARSGLLPDQPDPDAGHAGGPGLGGDRGGQTAGASIGREGPGRWARIGSTAVAVGITSGFFGVGGGFLIVPGLAWAGQLDLKEAARSGLVAITAFAALIGLEYLASGSADISYAGVMLLGGLAGGAAGVWLAGRVPRRLFQQAFAVFLLLIGAALIAH
jgi:uncharacterized protein